MGTSEGLSFNLFVPARFGTLDVKAKYHHVMRCCPACGAPLVLFREKFGDAAGRPSAHARSPPGKGPGSDGGSPTRISSGITGGWVCTKCGVHILPTADRTQISSPTSPDEKKPGDDHSTKKPSSKPNSREASPHRPGDRQGTPGSPLKPHSNPTSPTSPKPPVVIDDDYEVWERQVKNAFVAFLNQIRDRLGHKETSLKQYQVTLCQRERTLRSSEESMQQRINKIKHSEQSFKTKMDRLNLYKETMIHQLEAKAKQLTQYEQRLRNMDFRSSQADIRGSMRDIRTANPEYRHPKDVLNTSVASVRNTSADSRNTNGDIWNTSAVSDYRNSSVTSPTEGRAPQKKSADQWNRLGGRRPKGRPEVVDSRPTAPPAEVRGSQSALARDFRPTGATSANINQIYTREAGGVYGRSAAPSQSHIKQTNLNSSVLDNSNYMYDKKRSQAQESISPPAPTSPKGSILDVRTKQAPTANGPVVDIRRKISQPGQPTSPNKDPSSHRWTAHTNLHVTNGPEPITKPHVVTSFAEHDSMSLSGSSHQHHSPSDKERSTSGLSDLSPTYTTSGYASDRDASLNGVRRQGDGGQREQHNVSFDDVLSTSSPQNTVERDTRPPWMKRRSRRLTEV